MTNNAKKILKGSTLRIALLMSSIVIGLFMMPFLIHSLGDEEYGMWVLVSAVVSFYSLMDFGMASAMQRFLIRSIHSKDPEDSNIALSTSVVLSTAVAVVTFLITIVIIVASPLYISEEVNSTLFSITIAIIGFKASLQLPLFSYYGILVANYRYDIISTVQFFSMLARAILIVIFVKSGYGIIAIAAIALITDIAGSLVIVRSAKRLIPGIKTSLFYFRVSKLKEYFHFGKWTYVIQITHKVRFSIDEFVVGSMLGLGAVTHYAIASALISYFSSFMESAFGVFAPVFHKYHKLNQWDKLREAFTITTEISAYASMLIGCLLFLLGESFINVWMGDDYSDTYIVLLILCTANIFYKSLLPCEKIIFAIAKQQFYAKISTLEAIANLLLSIALAPKMGIYGVALGTLIPSLVTNSLLPMYTCRQLTLPYRSFYTILVKAIGLGILIFVPMRYLINSFEPENIFMIALYGVALGVVYTVVCFRFFISSEATALIMDSLPDKIVVYIKPLARKAK